MKNVQMKNVGCLALKSGYKSMVKEKPMRNDSFHMEEVRGFSETTKPRGVDEI